MLGCLWSIEALAKHLNRFPLGILDHFFPKYLLIVGPFSVINYSYPPFSQVQAQGL